ncbi:MAG: glycosyltransferase family 4 protein [Sinobacteraceae bacterium]|nr:glycosyltransferase family 4 protein [Nevskiaceae bacterium]
MPRDTTAGRRLRVLQVNSVFAGGGIDSQTLELVRGLLANGAEVTLAVCQGSGMIPQAQAVPQLRLVILPSSRWAFIRALSRDIRSWQPDIVHAHFGRDHWPAIIASWLAGHRPRVVASRHLIHVNSFGSRAMLLRCADVVAVSQAVRTVLDASLHGPRSRLHQVYGGVDCRYFLPVPTRTALAAKAKLGFDADDVVFSVLGFFNPPRGKGQMEFLRAAARLHGQNPHARFLIVGAGGLQAEMQTFIADNGLQETARIMGWQRDVREVLAATDVLVYPAVEPEALGMTLWEAMACGRPVVATAMGGMPEAFEPGRHGLLVPPDDVDALAAAMLRLASDADLRRRWGSAASGYIRERASTPAFGRRMLRLYHEILRRERRDPASAA